MFVKLRRVLFLPVKYAYHRWQWHIETPLVSPEWLLERRSELETAMRVAEKKNDVKLAHNLEGKIEFIDEIHENKN